MRQRDKERVLRMFRDGCEQDYICNQFPYGTRPRDIENALREMVVKLYTRKPMNEKARGAVKAGATVCRHGVRTDTAFPCELCALAKKTKPKSTLAKRLRGKG